MDHSTVSSGSNQQGSATSQPALESAATGAVRSRLDPPHHVDQASPSIGSEPPVTKAGETAVTRDREVLERHAAELADHLRGWEADLARRERCLHEQSSALDRERRQFRLWMQEMQYALEAQRESLEQLRAAAGGDPFKFPIEDNA